MVTATDAPFLLACRRCPAPHVPVWFMRQAGRALPEYRAIRGTGGILEVIREPELVAELTIQPVRRYGVDAAILYSDIMVPVAAVGFGVEVVPGKGPVIDEPFGSKEDLSRLRPLEPEEDTPYVLEAVRMLVGELDVPLIGFAGAPFTVASYLVEGGPSRHFARTKALMHGEPETWEGLADTLAELALTSLVSQVRAGAQAVQLFDSWVGTLSPLDYSRHVLPATRRIFEGLAHLNVPTIHFGVGTGELLVLMAEAGGDVIGVDWRVPIDLAWERIGYHRGVQGNLDPAICLAPWDVVQAHTEDILRRVGGRPGHVFNLGHGVLPETDPSVLQRVVEQVHQHG